MPLWTKALCTIASLVALGNDKKVVIQVFDSMNFTTALMCTKCTVLQTFLVMELLKGVMTNRRITYIHVCDWFVDTLVYKAF